MKWLVRVVPLLIGLALVTIEGLVRLTLAPVDPLFLQDHDRLRAAANAVAFTGDPDLGWRLRPMLQGAFWEGTTVTTTRDGFRAGHEFPRPKRGPRVICAGDSVTFGYRVPLTSPLVRTEVGLPQAAYPVLLERMLRRRFPEREIDVVPLAAPGYSSLQGRLWLEREIASLDPDLVTILYGFNDASPGRPDRDTYSGPRRWARHVVFGSQALMHLLLAVQRLAPPSADAREEPGPRVTQEQFVANVRAMVDMARGHGAAVAVIAPVYRETNPAVAMDARIGAYRRALASACGDWGVTFLEVPELTESMSTMNLSLFADHAHPNAAGQALLAERLFGLVQERDLLRIGSPP